MFDLFRIFFLPPASREQPKNAILDNEDEQKNKGRRNHLLLLSCVKMGAAVAVVKIHARLPHVCGIIHDIFLLVYFGSGKMTATTWDCSKKATSCNQL